MIKYMLKSLQLILLNVYYVPGMMLNTGQVLSSNSYPAAETGVAVISTYYKRKQGLKKMK